MAPCMLISYAVTSSMRRAVTRGSDSVILGHNKEFPRRGTKEPTYPLRLCWICVMCEQWLPTRYKGLPLGQCDCCSLISWCSAESSSHRIHASGAVKTSFLCCCTYSGVADIVSLIVPPHFGQRAGLSAKKKSPWPFPPPKGKSAYSRC